MSTATLVPCGGCHRHVRAHESACPFCAHPLSDLSAEGIVPEPQQRLSRAGVLAFAAAFLSTACPSREAPSPFSSADSGMMQTIYGGPPPQLAPPTPQATPEPMTPPVDAAAPAVDAAAPQVVRPRPNNHHPVAAPAYGLPPPRLEPVRPLPPPQRPGGSISTRYGSPPRPDDDSEG
ncbi:MAG: hypothetical protein IPF99_42615 [Deltaproteobacteria bacterium]|nr:hypothetical protein [Deltaproteobacteria bacterium]MBK7065582.1 hypothetical protein [Deltaproteobacteria bacterium]